MKSLTILIKQSHIFLQKRHYSNATSSERSPLTEAPKIESVPPSSSQTHFVFSLQCCQDLPPTPCSVTPCLQPKIICGQSIYTTEIGEHYKSRLCLPLKPSVNPLLARDCISLSGIALHMWLLLYISCKYVCIYTACTDNTLYYIISLLIICPPSTRMCISPHVRCFVHCYFTMPRTVPIPGRCSVSICGMDE